MANIQPDKNDFFRQATLLLCSSLEIEKALFSCMKYLKQYIPIDQMSLVEYVEEFWAVRTVAEVTASGGKQVNRLTYISKEKRKWLINGNLERDEEIKKTGTEIINRPELNPIAECLFADFGYAKASILVLSLTIEDQFLGQLVLHKNGKDQYNINHARLLNLLIEPFSMAMSNHLEHNNVLQLKEKFEDDNRYLHEELYRKSGEDIIGEHFELKGVMEMVRRVAPLESPVLLSGETGVGKDLIAQAIHKSSNRKEGPFITVNSGAIPESLLDSELFGYEKGAFTGAISDKRGRIERADGGTIFLDEIGELTPPAQVRLLRVIQNREIDRVGGSSTIKVNVRIIAATHRDLEGMVHAGQFREDLWYRLNVFPIMIPPLRERKRDIPTLVQHFIDRKSREMNLSDPVTLHPGAIDSLMAYNWPGNVRELENVVERALILNIGEPLKFEFLIQNPKADHPVVSIEPTGEFIALESMTTNYIKRALRHTHGKINGPGGAAELLDIKPNTLRSKIKKLGIRINKKSLKRNLLAKGLDR
ncbi:MAG: sigma 54-interacting transcriptional regulator [Deltaproteobacteria bacterium]|nr:sigma 54-interacting transcriptional regulator [Deltaproteobacteria bacterium]